MGTACCAGERVVTTQPASVKLSEPISLISKPTMPANEFADLAQTSKSVAAVEESLDALAQETNDIEKGVAQTTTAARTLGTSVGKLLSEIQKQVPLPVDMTEQDYSQTQIQVCLDKQPELVKAIQDLSANTTALVDSCSRATKTTEQTALPKFIHSKALISGLEKRVLKWTAETQDASLLQGKLDGMKVRLQGIEVRLSLLLKLTPDERLVESLNKQAEAVECYLAAANRDTGEIVVEEEEHWENAAVEMEVGTTIEKDAMSQRAMTEGVEASSATPLDKAVSLPAETPSSAVFSPTEAYDAPTPVFAFPPVVVASDEKPTNQLEISGIYSEANESVGIQQQSLLRKICLQYAKSTTPTATESEVKSVFLKLLRKKYERDQELMESGKMDRKVENYVVKYFADNFSANPIESLMGVMKGLLTYQLQKVPFAEFICRMTNVFVPNPYPPYIAAVFPLILNSLNPDSEQDSEKVHISTVFDFAYSRFGTDLMPFLRSSRPARMHSTDFTALVLCYQLQQRGEDLQFQQVSSDPEETTVDEVAAGLKRELQPWVSDEDLRQALESLSQSGKIARVAFLRTFRARRIYELPQTDQYTVSIFDLLSTYGDLCLDSRRQAIEATARQFLTVRNRDKMTLEEAGELLQIDADTAEKAFEGKRELWFEELLACAEKRALGLFAKAYFVELRIASLDDEAQPECVTDVASSLSPNL